MYMFLSKVKFPEAAVLFTVYLSFLLDNILLTVVVPIIPDYLFHKDKEEYAFNNDSSRYHPKSLSPLQHKYENLEKDNGPLGALLASKSFVQLIFTPLVGHVTNAVGYHLPLLVGSCNMILAALCFAYGKSYGVLVLARALHGSASSAITVSGMGLLAERFSPESRSKLMPIAFGGIATGVLLGYPLGGAAYNYLGKPVPFLIIALFMLLNVVLELWLFEEQSNYKKIELSEGNANWIALIKDKYTLIVTLCICTVTTSMAVLESCLPLWLLERMETPSKWQLGAVFIPDSVGYFLGSHFGGFLPVTSWRLALIGMVFAGLNCCGIPLATNLHQLIIPHFGLGLGIGLVDAALVPLLANLVDSKGNTHYGPIYALQQISVNLAYAFGPLLGGEAVQVIGFPNLMGIVGLTNIFVCIFLVELENLQLMEE